MPVVITASTRGATSGQTSDQTVEAGLPSAHGYLAPSGSRREASLQKKVSSGPHAIHIGNREDSTTRTTAWRLFGQVSRGPSGVSAQSTASRSRPTSPLRRKVLRTQSPSEQGWARRRGV